MFAPDLKKQLHKINHHCIKDAKIQVFSEGFSPDQRKLIFSHIFTVHINANGDPRLFPAGSYMSELTIETLEQGVEYAQTLLVFVWLTLNIFHTLI